jgi:hypothetical protein
MPKITMPTSPAPTQHRVAKSIARPEWITTWIRRAALVGLCALLLGTMAVSAQQSKSPARPQSGSGAGTLPPPAAAADAEFLQAADEVLGDMSKLLSLPVLEPLKKSVRSRDEIRDYLVKSMKEDKKDDKRDADRKTLEALGLIPKGYPLDQKLLSLLTEQIAGMYDPKSREFFIADWTSPADQRMIMAHELTHALQDQHFHVEKWQDAAKPNDDGELARSAVLEGSATVAMLDYLLRNTGKSSLDISDLDPSLLLGDPDDSPELADAPQIIRDEMLFPYIPGATFIQHLLKAWGGWPGIHKVFENPPTSTQQILHPDLYLQGVTRPAVSLPNLGKILPRGWKKLDENLLGEFGLNEVLKQFLGRQRADDLASSWAGDRYAIFERQPAGRILLVVRLRFASDTSAARFFGGYSEVLEKKDQEHTDLLRRPNFFSFDTPDGGVFLRCFANECLTVEGTTREVFDSVTHAIGWPAAEPAPRKQGSGVSVETRLRHPLLPVTGNVSPCSTPATIACASPQGQ